MSCSTIFFNLYKMGINECNHHSDQLYKFMQTINSTVEVIKKFGQDQSNEDAQANVRNITKCISDVIDFSSQFRQYLEVRDMEIRASSALLQEIPRTAPELLVDIDDSIDRETEPPYIREMEENGADGLLEEKSNLAHIMENGSTAIPLKDLSIYKPGTIINASITSITDLQSLSFYICDTDCNDMRKIAYLSQQVELPQNTALPFENEIFGLIQDKIVVRGIRRNKTDLKRISSKENCHPVDLLDFGDMVTITSEDITYQLNEDQKQIPAQAILCKLHESPSNTLNKRKAEELQALLHQLEYKSAIFKVMKVKDRVIHLELYTQINNPLPEVVDTNPFNQYIVSEEYKCTDEIADADIKRIGDHVVTPNELEELYDEPLNTTNSMEAMIGYDPQDDKRICRFYDPKKGTCFKGSNCKKEHKYINMEGYTKDSVISNAASDRFVPETQYATDSIISVAVTHVRDLEYFYAQINDLKTPLEPIFWKDEDIQIWDRLTKYPFPFDVVLAKYEDNFWYRAKVLHVDEINKLIKVFYVDYGNEQFVDLKHLAHCNFNKSKIPFHVTKCRIANIRDCANSEKVRQKGIDTLCNYILNKTFAVQVFSHHEELVINFIGEPLCSLPYILQKLKCVTIINMVKI